MLKRFINPTMIFALLLFLGAMVWTSPSTVEAQTTALSWVGNFYPSNNFTGTSVDGILYSTGLSQNWGAGAPTNPTNGQPLPGMPPDNFSARFASNPNITGGLYEFIVVADGGVRLSINNQILIDDLTNEGQESYSVIVSLETGAYSIILDYVDYSGNALIQISLVTTDGTPTGNNGGNTPPIATGEVVQVRGLSVRSGPFLGGTLLGVARPGVSYSILARNTQEGLFTWYLIQYDSDTQGWVSGRYFALTEETASIPLVEVEAFTTVYDPPGLVTGVTRSNMNFRTLPTQRAPRVSALPQLDWGAYVEILARTRQGGEDYWYMVRYTVPNTTTSYVGWIFAPFVDIVSGSDPIETVPRL